MTLHGHRWLILRRWLTLRSPNSQYATPATPERPSDLHNTDVLILDHGYRFSAKETDSLP
ncbi:hypothetical protein U9M48_030855 [Paspalum notatum var. saurae]|uniref:Uncharacterized protein n=1 Tax=Paspalum notatum var. saurae TaxID=547442 RepID=A0AAQ3U1K5_PASNO